VTVADALMLALGVIAVGSGALVVTSTHLVRAGLYLVISLGAIAGLYLVLGAELVAWVQVLVYVGAVVVLLLFAVMLTRAPIGPSTDLDRPAGPAALIGAGVGLGLAALLADAFHWTRYDLPPTGSAERVGEQIFGGWVLPFEVLSILLLAALVGAVVLSRPDLGARPDPEAALVPAAAPTPDPMAESAEVVARLERIAARQANAQARLRQTAAEQRAATAEPGPPEPAATPADPTVREVLKGKAADVIFGAQARRTRVGGDAPPEPGTTPDDVIEGTATETRPSRPAVGPGRTARPEAQSSRPAVGAGPTEPRSGRPAVGPGPTEPRSGRPAVGPGPAAKSEVPPRRRPLGKPETNRALEGENPAPPSRRVAGRPARPALPAGDDSAGDDSAGDDSAGDDSAGKESDAKDREGDA
jgi:NADH:ubiquinone oxidoreductase subunit 6 (subunit J)